MKYVVVVPYTVQSVMDEFMATCKLENVLKIDNTTNNIGCMASHNLGVDKMYETESDWLIIISPAIRFGSPGGLDFVEKLKNTNRSFHPPYNRRACEYFNMMMEGSDFFIQHAENFGEFHIKELGYFVDGYDTENNIVYEWDEKEHFIDQKRIEKDRIRQEKIEKFLGCQFVRIRQWY